MALHSVKVVNPFKNISIYLNSLKQLLRLYEIRSFSSYFRPWFVLFLYYIACVTIILASCWLTLLCNAISQYSCDIVGKIIILFTYVVSFRACCLNVCHITTSPLSSSLTPFPYRSTNKMKWLHMVKYWKTRRGIIHVWRQKLDIIKRWDSLRGRWRLIDDLWGLWKLFPVSVIAREIENRSRPDMPTLTRYCATLMLLFPARSDGWFRFLTWLCSHNVIANCDACLQDIESVACVTIVRLPVDELLGRMISNIFIGLLLTKAPEQIRRQ